VHGDPAITARMFLDVLDHWKHGGPGAGSQQWLTLRYVTRLLVRLGADTEAAALHYALVDLARTITAAQQRSRCCAYVLHM